MRWFVVRASAPLAYTPPGTAHAHPPGPGFPRHAPSVYTVVATPAWWPIRPQSWTLDHLGGGRAPTIAPVAQTTGGDAGTDQAGWICPSCDRRFRRAGQSHECSPAMSVEDYFSTGPPHERPIFDAVVTFLETLGPVHVEPVSVGIFFKRAQTFAQLRPMLRWSALSFSLAHEVQHERITKKVIPYQGRYHHVANLRGPHDLDDRLRGWLRDAYEASPL